VKPCKWLLFAATDPNRLQDFKLYCYVDGTYHIVLMLSIQATLSVAMELAINPGMKSDKDEITDQSIKY
jgi:hypothetical protein